MINILVFAGNIQQFHEWCLINNLGQERARFCSRPEDLMGMREAKFTVTGTALRDNPLMGEHLPHLLRMMQLYQFKYTRVPVMQYINTSGKFIPEVWSQKIIGSFVNSHTVDAMRFKTSGINTSVTDNGIVMLSDTSV